MAMQLSDGFDVNSTNALLTLFWDNSPGASFPTGVYTKGKALQLSTGTGLTKTFAVNYVTGMVGMHFFMNSIVNNSQIFIWQDAAINQVDVRTDGAGALFFTRNGTTIGSVSTLRLAPNTWYWLEFQVTIDPAAGVAKAFINGTSALSGTGLNTRNTANSFFNQIVLKGQNTNFTFDSFHFWDSTAGDVSAFPYGEHILDTSLANAVGSNGAWTQGGTPHANNFQQVNEATEDGDTTYVTPTAANQIDSYGFASLLESTGTIGFVAVKTIARVDDAPVVHQYDHFTKSGGSTALSAAITPSASYLGFETFFGTDPNTAAAWTIAGRNAAEFGYKDLS